MNKQLLTLTLTAALSFHAGQAMDEERLAEKNKEAIVPENLQRFQPLSLKDTCAQKLLPTKFDYKSIQGFAQKHEALKDILELQETLAQELVSQFYPQLLGAYKKKFGDFTIKHRSGDHPKFSPDGKHMITSDLLLPAQIWRHQDNKWVLTKTIDLRLRYCACADFSPDSKHLIIINGNLHQIWTYQEGKWVNTGNIESTLHQRVGHLFSSNSDYLITTKNSQSCSAQLWNYHNNSWELIQTPDNCYPLMFVDDLVACLDDNNNLNIWTCSNKGLQYFSPFPKLQVLPEFWESIIGHSDNREIHVGKIDNVMKISSTTEYISTKSVSLETNYTSLTNDQDNIRKVKFSPNNLHFVTLSDDVAKIWTQADGTWQHTHTIAHENSIDSIQFSNNGQHLAVTFKGSSPQCWTYENKTWQATAVPNIHNNRVSKMTFSPAGHYLAINFGFHSTVLRYKNNQWLPEQTITANPSLESMSCSFSPDDNFVLFSVTQIMTLNDTTHVLPTSRYFESLSLEELSSFFPEPTILDELEKKLTDFIKKIIH
ncbi:MAG: hypothetical protein H6679_01485 [Epsilonproteobacteria bacterium]|nr:hypothetical protein [Campylobacterota bacterium]